MPRHGVISGMHTPHLQVPASSASPKSNSHEIGSHSVLNTQHCARHASMGSGYWRANWCHPARLAIFRRHLSSLRVYMGQGTWYPAESLQPPEVCRFIQFGTHSPSPS
eukprot:2599180-Rhodomonas_salina.5